LTAAWRAAGGALRLGDVVAQATHEAQATSSRHRSPRLTTSHIGRWSHL